MKRFQPGDVVVNPEAWLGEVVRHTDSELVIKWDADDEFTYSYAPNGCGIRLWSEVSSPRPSSGPQEGEE